MQTLQEPPASWPRPLPLGGPHVASGRRLHRWVTEHMNGPGPPAHERGPLCVQQTVAGWQAGDRWNGPVLSRSVRPLSLLCLDDLKVPCCL